MESQFRLVEVGTATVCLWLHTGNDPTSAEWTQSCGVVADLVRRKRGDLAEIRGFVVSDGGAPNAVQRREILQAWQGKLARAAVVTPVFLSIPLKRGVATVFSWLMPNLKFFAPRDVRLAIEHIDIGEKAFETVWLNLKGMEASLAPSRTLELIGGALDRPLSNRASTATSLNDRYGPYEAVRHLGSGGTADVFEARHIESGTRVALKVLRDVTAGDERAVLRVIAEGRALTALRHPHVVSVIDVSTRDKVPYLVMDLLEGEDLSHWLSRRKALPVREAIDLVLPVVSGTHAMHAAGLVHRDLKPSNVFLACRQGQVLPVIVDFGLAKFVNSDAAATTSTAMGAGTPQYVAPERVRGLRAGPAGDQYALGAMLYECLTGGSPFSGEDRYELLHAIVTGRVVPPSEVNSEVPPGLDEVVLRAMARDPEARFPNVRMLGAALVGFASADGERKWRTELSRAASLHASPDGSSASPRLGLSSGTVPVRSCVLEDGSRATYDGDRFQRRGP